LAKQTCHVLVDGDPKKERFDQYHPQIRSISRLFVMTISVVGRLAVCIAALLIFHQVHAQDVPTDVKSELMRREVLAAIQRGDAATALAGITKIRAAGKVPPPLLYAEGVLAEKSEPLRAFDALVQYFAAVSKNDPNYETALALYSRLEPVAKGARKTKFLSEIRASMVPIPAGRFRMGDTARVAGKGRAAETPIRDITVPAFSLSRVVFTLRQFQEFQFLSGKLRERDFSKLKICSECPVLLGWTDANTIFDWLRSESGLRYRLPSESEWEYAARGGTSTAYWWGDKFDPTREAMQLLKHDGMPIIMSSGMLDPVGTHAANPFGLYDMLGNGAELTQDCVSNKRGLDDVPADGSAYITPHCSAHRARGVVAGLDEKDFRVSNRDQVRTTVPSNAEKNRVVIVHGYTYATLRIALDRTH
jgi:formylglycine-generating enzyme required for sulfatase activity